MAAGVNGDGWVVEPSDPDVGHFSQTAYHEATDDCETIATTFGANGRVIRAACKCGSVLDHKEEV